MPTQIKNLDELLDLLNNQDKRITSLEVELKEMRTTIKEIAEETESNSIFIDEDLPNTGLISKNFLRRAFTVWGHFTFAQLIISFFIGLGYLIITLGILKSFLK